MIEVTGLDRPGLLYELTATLSKLNLNIASAHVATFGERVVDVFYVTDLSARRSPRRRARRRSSARCCNCSQAADQAAKPARCSSNRRADPRLDR